MEKRKAKSTASTEQPCAQQRTTTSSYQSPKRSNKPIFLEKAWSWYE
eukprot:COSAG06_NODE_406_length_16115_cov_38.420142_1_plen_46_part_10